MSRNMLFITGTNVERTRIKKYKEEISHDRDIKKLIRTGTFALKWKPLIGIILSFLSIITFIISNPFLSTNLEEGIVYNVNKWAQTIIPLEYNFIPLYVAIILILSTLLSMIMQVVDYISAFSKKGKGIKRALHFILGAHAPRTPLELWDILQASIMDAQLTTSAERLFNTDVSLIYGGMPYYELHLVDCIYIKWEGLQKVSRSTVRHHFRRFFRKFSATTLISEAEKKYFSKDSVLQASNSVFGTLFLSEYIQSFIKSRKIEFNGKFEIDCSSILNDNFTKKNHFTTNLKSNALAYRVARELMGYSTNPTFFTFNTSSEPNLKLKICRIDFIGVDKSPSAKCTHFKSDIKVSKEKISTHKTKDQMSAREIRNYCRRNGIIQVPVKKLISLPYGQIEIGDPLPPSILSPKNRLISFSDVLVLGGAEQNVILSNIINTYKWRFDFEKSNEANFHYHGFAENVFDMFGLKLKDGGIVRTPGNIDYLVGTEGFVYGNWRYLRSKIQEQDDGKVEEHRNMAEVLKLKIKDTTYYFIYGYHAVATKIATMKFFVYNESTDKDIRDKYLPDDRKKRLTYEMTFPMRPDFYGLLDFWDIEDPINSSKDALLEKLERINVKPI